MKYFILSMSIFIFIFMSFNSSFSFTIDDYLNNKDVNEYLLELIEENCVNKGILNCRKIVKNAFNGIDSEDSKTSRFRIIKFAWFYSFGYYYFIENAIKIKEEKKLNILPIEKEEYRESKKYCDLIIDKMGLENNDEKIRIILMTRQLFVDYIKNKIDNERKIKATEDLLNGIRERMETGKLTDKDNDAILNRLPKEFSLYDKKMMTDKLDKTEYKIYKLLKDFLSIMYDFE